MRRPAATGAHVERGRGMHRLYKDLVKFVGATHASPCGDSVHVERGRGMPRPYEDLVKSVGATHASPCGDRVHVERRRGMPRPYEYSLSIVLAEPEGKPSPWRASWHATVLPRASRRSYAPVKLARLRRHPHAREEVRRFARAGEAVALRNRSTAAAFCRSFPTRHDNKHSTCVTVQR